MAAALVRRPVTGLARAVLPAVDDRDFDEIAEREAIVDPHQRAVRTRQDRPHRHMLVERLIGRRAPDQELRRIVEIFRVFVGVIVLHFVIVPGDKRRHLRVQALQVLVQSVLRIAVAIGRQRRRFDAIGVPAHDRPVLFDGFVDVVAEENDELRIFLGEMPVGGKITVLVIGAGHVTEAQAVKRCARRRQGDRASDRARRVAALEAIPIGPARLQAGDVEVHRIAEHALGCSLAAAHDFCHGLVTRNLVAQGDVAAAHAAGGFRIARQRLGRQPRPQHKAVRARRAGSDAQAEWIAGMPALRGGVAQQSPVQRPAPDRRSRRHRRSGGD